MGLHRWVVVVVGLAHHALGCRLLENCLNQQVTEFSDKSCGNGRVDVVTFYTDEECDPLATEITCGIKSGQCSSFSGADVFDNGVLVSDSHIDCLQEQCDDGNNVDGDGCTDCQLDGFDYQYVAAETSIVNTSATHFDTFECVYGINEGYTFGFWGAAQYLTVDDVKNTFGWDSSALVANFTTCCITRVCGNGVLNCDYTDTRGVYHPEEECDDGGSASGDGCSASCNIEVGWDCFSGDPRVAEPTMCDTVPNFVTPQSEVTFLVEWYNHTTGWSNNDGWDEGLASAWAIENVRCEALYKHDTLLSCHDVCNVTAIENSNLNWTLATYDRDVFSCTEDLYNMVEVKYGLIQGSITVDDYGDVEAAVQGVVDTLVSNAQVTIVGFHQKALRRTDADDEQFQVVVFNVTVGSADDAAAVVSGLTDDLLDESLAAFADSSSTSLSSGNLFSITPSCTQQSHNVAYVKYHKALCDACCTSGCQNTTAFTGAMTARPDALEFLAENCTLLNTTAVNVTECLVGDDCELFPIVDVYDPYTQVRVVNYSNVADPCGYCRGQQTCPKWYGLACDTCRFANGSTAECDLVYRVIRALANETTPVGSVHVTELNLASNGIQGGMVDYRDPVHMATEQVQQLSALPYLAVLDLYGNRLTGLSPGIDWAAFEGLATTDLSFNNLSSVAFMSGMYALDVVERLLLNDNRLQGEIDPYAFATEACITGSGTCETMTSLLDLDLTNNLISGAVPLSLQALPSLTTAQLKDNQFQSLAGLRLPDNVLLLELQNNKLASTLPASLFACSTCSVVAVLLANNQLTGSLPRTINQLPALMHLDLANNRLSGSIPDEIGTMPSVRTVHLNDNAISGTLPLTLQFMQTVQEMDLSNNQIASPMPEGLFTFVRALTSLDVSGNELTNLDLSLGEMDALVHLNLSNNHIPTLPASLSDLTNLQVLDFSNNDVSSFPDLATLTSLTALHAHTNQIAGTIPDTFAGIPLRTLNLQRNNLTGSLPATWATLSLLRAFDASNNLLDEGLPRDLDKLTNLQDWVMSNNLIGGTLSESVGVMRLLRTLRLNNNLITGAIPTTLGSLEFITRLDLSHNEFTSSIPSELGSLGTLSDLDLSDNVLTGSIPSQLFMRVSALSRLAFADNRLSGRVPDEIALVGPQVVVAMLNSGSYSCPFPEGSLDNVLRGVNCEQCPDDESANPPQFCAGDDTLECVTCSSRGVCDGGSEGVCSCFEGNGWTGSGCDFLECGTSQCSLNVTDDVGVGVGVHGTCQNNYTSIRCLDASRVAPLNVSDVQAQALAEGVDAMGGATSNYTAEQVAFAMSVSQYALDDACVEAADTTMAVCSQEVGDLFVNETACFYKRFQIAWCDCEEGEWEGVECEIEYVEPPSTVNVWVGAADHLAPLWTAVVVALVVVRASLVW